jgi:hypothetical protein
MKVFFEEMRAERETRHEEIKATLRSGLKEIFEAITGASWESIEAREEKAKALPEKTEACLVEYVRLRFAVDCQVILVYL